MIKFSRYILLFDVSSLILIGIPVYLLVGTHVFIPGLLAFAITTILALASYFPFTRIRNATINNYMAAMLSGMFIRMIFIGVSIVLVFVFTELHQIGFTVALLFSYICKSVIETVMITKKQRGHSSVAK